MSSRQQSGLISVIVTAHNEGSEVVRTLESIRANTPGPYEIVLVDDASTDDACVGLELESCHTKLFWLTNIRLTVAVTACRRM